MCVQAVETALNKDMLWLLIYFTLDFYKEITVESRKYKVLGTTSFILKN